MKNNCQNKNNCYLLITDKNKIHIISIMNYNNDKLIYEYQKNHFNISIYMINNIISSDNKVPYITHIKNNSIIVNNYVINNLFYRWRINCDLIDINNITLFIKHENIEINKSIKLLISNKTYNINNLFQEIFKYKRQIIITNNNIKQYLLMLKYCNFNKFKKQITNNNLYTYYEYLKLLIKELKKLKMDNKIKQYKNHYNITFNRFGCQVIIKNNILITSKIGCYNVDLKYILYFLCSITEEL